EEDEIGTYVQMEGGSITSQEAVQCPIGTSFSVRNLFYNVPARRYFLKSDNIEFRHISEEFHRVVLTHPEIEFTLVHQGSEIHQLTVASLRQRIIHLFGTKYQDKLIHLEEETEIVRIIGFIGKPDIAKKTRGEQYFFLNHRFIKNSYLHHAIASAFDQILPAGQHPLYLVYLDIDPDQIDINIHPTKTEVKFQDERSIYAILHATVKRAIGKSQLTPSLDFEQETAIRIPPITSNHPIAVPKIDINESFNPFPENPRATEREHSLQRWFEQKSSPKNWQTLFEGSDSGEQQAAASHTSVIGQVGKFILCKIENELWFVHARRAHQRILFEDYRNHWNPTIQCINPPLQVDLPIYVAATFQDEIAEWKSFGFDCSLESDGELFIHGIPSNWSAQQAIQAIGAMVENAQQDYHHLPSIQDDWCWMLAKKESLTSSRMLTSEEMNNLIVNLLRTQNPEATPSGSPIIKRMTEDQIQQYF
ncbi:MAG: DNA mismatch repair endonuclease MutL, partial [Flavobacteriales bacterium]